MKPAPPERPESALRPPRYWGIVGVFVAMTCLQASVAVWSIDLLSTVRAYVTGESLYSKGQKDAQIYLIEYAEKHREEDYAKFMAALAVPLSDRMAREALQRPVPDEARAEQGLLAGGNHPSDIAGAMRLFRWFQDVPFMSRPIATWTEGDRVIEQMRALVDTARAGILAGRPDAAAIQAMRSQAPLLNQRLTALESTFSAQLGEASRATQRLLLALNGSIAVLLTLTGLVFVRRSARMQAATQAEVVERQAFQQRLLDSAAEGLYGVDLEGRCTFINRAALNMLGYARESELLGRDVHTVIQHSQADGRALPASASSVYQAYRTRQSSHSVDEILWRRDGTSFHVESWCHPIIHDGEVRGAVATFFDITERVEMQVALRRGELRMERLIDAVTDGVVTMDSRQTIVLFNRAAEQMFGTPAAQAIGSRMDRFIASSGSVADLTGPLHELVGKREDGVEFPMEASLSRLDTERGLLTTVVLRDVSALHAANAERRARQALEAANQAKTDFLSRMSHELRTPLNAVIGFSHLLRLDASQALSAEQLERVAHIENAGEHLLALVNDVLDLSRIESGEMTLLQDTVSVRAIVEEAITMVSPLVTEAGVEVFVLTGARATARSTRAGTRATSALAQDPAWVAADRVRLRQVLVNLLSNAIKYNRPGGQVSVAWSLSGNGNGSKNGSASECEVLVADTGQGIAPDMLDCLFEPFNRLGAEHSRVEGTGIGLVLSRQLAEMMGGTLTVRSTFGQGTTVRLTLRRAPAPPDDTPLPEFNQVEAGAGHRLDILYAEDNEVNAELVRQVVRLRPSVSLRVAESGSRALELALLDPPDLMLLDMNLGDMTGLDLARALRSDRSTRGVRLVALSADALPEQIEAAMRWGFERYLTKPIVFAELLAVIDRSA